MHNSKTTDLEPKKRGIYLLPNLLTISAMFAGFYAIIAAMHQHFVPAATAIFIAMILDGLDGRVARLLHAQSEFGVQIDSLSDMLCFGITPALVLYSYTLSSIGKLGWLVAFLYAVCTALRLARFNTQTKKADKRYFQGLATPAAAACVASLIWVYSIYHIPGKEVAVLTAAITLILSLLKVSNIRYRSFKDLNLEDRVPFITILMIVLILVLISYKPSHILLILTTLYVISGPFLTLWHLKKKKKQAKTNTQEKNDSTSSSI